MLGPSLYLVLATTTTEQTLKILVLHMQLWVGGGQSRPVRRHHGVVLIHVEHIAALPHLLVVSSTSSLVRAGHGGAFYSFFSARYLCITTCGHRLFANLLFQDCSQSQNLKSPKQTTNVFNEKKKKRGMENGHMQWQQT